MIKIGNTSIVNVLGSVRSVIVEIFKGFTQPASQMTCPGVDSAPLPGDQCLIFKLDNSTGKYIQIGTFNKSESLPGEIMIYSRNPAGVVQSSVYCDYQGFIQAKNNLMSLKTIMDNFIIAVKGITTTNCVVGSPVVLNPASIFALEAVKLQIAMLLKE
jgi:hypothetical protein